MKKNEMVEIAEFIKRIVVKKHDPDKVKVDVSVLRQGFQSVQYCFESTKKAYE